MLTVTEAGLYRLIFKSRKPIAKRFRHWVFHEVLPSICKTGSYSLPDAQTERMRLELELIRAKQHYQDTGHAIALVLQMLYQILRRGYSNVQFTERERLNVAVFFSVPSSGRIAKIA